jgi:hypothetical protein
MKKRIVFMFHCFMPALKHLAFVLRLIIVVTSTAAARAQDTPPAGFALPSTPAQKPLHEQATAAAWKAFNSGAYDEAIARADECIARFGSAADQIESGLETNKTEFPTGPATEADMSHMATYQILHDVAICLLIKGWAEEKLGNKVEAEKSYAQAKTYTLARWKNEKENSFWSPATAATRRLAALTKESSP